jgi:hypothetical protein
MRVIAFTGPKLSGKDTAAKCLFRHNVHENRNLFRKAMFAEGVKNMGTDYFGWTPEQMDDSIFKETPIALWEGGPLFEPRWFMMDEANGLRDRYSREIHARRWERHVHANPMWGAHVVTDLRFPPEEVEAIRRAGNTGHIMMPEAFGSLIIYVQRDEAEEALLKAQANMDPKALNASEAHYKRLKEEADFVLDNNGEIYHLNNKVNQLVHTKFGHWKHWQVMTGGIK